MGTIVANNVYKNISKQLSPKDGKIHTVMVSSFSSFKRLNYFVCDVKYTNELNCIVSSMQSDGYEIIDVKVCALPNQGFMKKRIGYSTLIVYK